MGKPQQFTLLGALANEKPSAIFKIDGGGGSGDAQVLDGSANGGGIGSSIAPAEDEMVDIQDAPPQVPGINGSYAPVPPQGDVVIGISVEPAADLNEQLAALRAPSSSTSSALILSTNRNPPSAISTKVLAQRIIKNAFNFLASFAGSTNAAGEEIVPLKSFRDWWVKFERRLENEPGFLEREGDG